MAKNSIYLLFDLWTSANLIIFIAIVAYTHLKIILIGFCKVIELYLGNIVAKQIV